MKLLQRLYLREFFTALFIVVAGLSTIFSLINLLDRLGGLQKYDPSLKDLFLYAALNIPKNLFYLLPMAVLICCMFVFAGAMKRNELVIIKAAGGGMRAFVLPFLAAGLMLSGFAFMLSEFVMPVTLEKAEELRQTIISQRQPGAEFSPAVRKPAMKDGVVWLKDRAGSLVRFGLYSYQGSAASDIRIYLFDKGVMKGHIAAEKAVWDGEVWKLLNVKRYTFDNGRIERIKELPYKDLETPRYFAERLKKTEEMGISELARYIVRMKKSGYSNPKLTVDLNSRISYPLINFFMIIFGLSLPLRGKVVKGLSASGIGLGISLLYWGGYVMSISLGNAGLLPAFLAPWLMPLLFGLIAADSFYRMAE